MKKWFWFPIAVVVTAVLLVAVLAAIFAPPVRTALASTLGGNGFVGGPPWARMWHGGGSGFNLPPSLQGLASIPADQRFAHFDGAQINLKDQDNNPLTLNVIPGKVTASSATSLTIAANRGGDKTFTLDDQTLIHAGAKAASTPVPSGTPDAVASLQNGEDVVVVTLNNDNTAIAVLAGNPSGFGWPGH
jgi:hypothetical protein